MYSGSAHFNDAVRTMGFSVRCIQGFGTQNHKFDLTEIERLYQQNYGESLF
jgi:hypothetical protein